MGEGHALISALATAGVAACGAYCFCSRPRFERGGSPRKTKQKKSRKKRRRRDARSGRRAERDYLGELSDVGRSLLLEDSDSAPTTPPPASRRGRQLAARRAGLLAPVDDLFDFFAEPAAANGRRPLVTQRSFERLILARAARSGATSAAEARREAKEMLRGRGRSRHGLHLDELEMLYEQSAGQAERDWHACFPGQAQEWKMPLEVGVTESGSSHIELRLRLQECALRLARLCSEAPADAEPLPRRAVFAPNDVHLRSSATGLELTKTPGGPRWASATVSTPPMSHGVHYAEFLAQPAQRPRHAASPSPRRTASPSAARRRELSACDIRMGLQVVGIGAEEVGAGYGCEIPADEVVGLLLDLESGDGELFLMREGAKPLLLCTGLRGGSYLWAADLSYEGDTLSISPLNANSAWLFFRQAGLRAPEAAEEGGLSVASAAELLYHQLQREGWQVHHTNTPLDPPVTPSLTRFVAVRSMWSRRWRCWKGSACRPRSARDAPNPDGQPAPAAGR